jgi:hypothetical protein
MLFVAEEVSEVGWCEVTVGWSEKQAVLGY